MRERTWSTTSSMFPSLARALPRVRPSSELSAPPVAANMDCDCENLPAEPTVPMPVIDAHSSSYASEHAASSTCFDSTTRAPALAETNEITWPPLRLRLQTSKSRHSTANDGGNLSVWCRPFLTIVAAIAEWRQVLLGQTGNPHRIQLHNLVASAASQRLPQGWHSTRAQTSAHTLRVSFTTRPPHRNTLAF